MTIFFQILHRILVLILFMIIVPLAGTAQHHGYYYSLTEALKEPDKVEYLSLMGISEVPAEIGKFKRLKKLSVYRSRLVRLPPEIMQLDSLREISLTEVQLKEHLPRNIGELQSLKRIYVGSLSSVRFPKRTKKQKYSPRRPDTNLEKWCVYRVSGRTLGCVGAGDIQRV